MEGRRIKDSIIKKTFQAFVITSTSVLPAQAMDLAGALVPGEDVNRVSEAYSDLQREASIREVLSDRSTQKLAVAQRLTGPSQIETTKFQHYYKGIEVIGSMAFHHVDQHHATRIRNNIAQFDLDARPSIDTETAAGLAQAITGGLELKNLPTLKILPNSLQSSATLIYWVELKGKGWTGNQDVIIDAHSGNLIASLSHDFTLISSTTPFTVYSARNLGVKVKPNISEDFLGPRKVKDCDFLDLETTESKTISVDECKAIFRGESSTTKNQCQVINGLDGFPLGLHFTSCKSVATREKTLDRLDKSAVKAAANSKQVLSYYKNHFNRESYDGKATELVSVIHAGEKMTNAFWTTDMNIMVYGDGDGKNMGDLTQAVDVAGHEMTHGITSQTAKLLMMGESGALNEAYSDYFGKLIEAKNDWMVGGNLFLNSSNRKGIRNLEDPGILQDTIVNDKGDRVKKPYPASARQAETPPPGQSCQSSNDYCWIHFNSTIPGHASYLIHQALGAKKAELLIYTVLTQNLSSTDTFASSAKVTIDTCKQLDYLEDDCKAVEKVYRDLEII